MLQQWLRKDVLFLERIHWSGAWCRARKGPLLGCQSAGKGTASIGPSSRWCRTIVCSDCPSCRASLGCQCPNSATLLARAYSSTRGCSGKLTFSLAFHYMHVQACQCKLPFVVFVDEGNQVVDLSHVANVIDHDQFFGGEHFAFDV